ncbi:MAG TPA: carbohydrate kinase [Acidobacteria bacterium]|nr:carbohydrate kinase [Acidobacteriota bacterium]
MSRAEHILAIDNGTQSVRALLFDLEGNLVARSKVELVPYLSDRPGWAEQDAGYYWEQLGLACRQLWETSPVARESVAGVALTTQRNTVIPVDDRGEPLRRAIVWLDQRRTEGLAPLGGAWGVAFRLLGLLDTVAYFQAEAESNWLAVHEPEVWRRTSKLLFLSGFLTHRLTGRFADSVGSQVGFLPFDYRALRWSSPRDWKWKAVPVRREMLPELVEPTGLLGTITAEASRATGIPEGLPLVAAAADKACEVLGSGALDTSIACLSYGTTATVNVTSRRYVEPLRWIPPYPAAVPGAYTLEVQIYRGYWMVSWFKREFGEREMRLAAERGVAPESLFDELVNRVPPGSEGLVLQPYWSPGVKIPGPEARGAVIGFSDVHTRAHIYRAILEGLAYALREGLERIEARTKVPVVELRVAGGGSQSDAALQLTADIFGLPVVRPHVYDASGLGAAMDAAVGLGLHPTMEAAVRAMTRPGRRFEPDPANRSVYDGLYRKVYRRLYHRLRPLYTEIRTLTGGDAGKDGAGGTIT